MRSIILSFCLHISALVMPASVIPMLAVPVLVVPLVAADSPSTRDDYLALWESAVEAYRSEDVSRAIARLQQVVKQTPRRAEAWLRLSNAYEWSGDLAAALDAGERAHALAHYGGSREAYRLARLGARKGDADLALRWLEHALEERFENRPEIATDESFENLSSNEHFRRLAGILPDVVASRVEGWRIDLAYLVEEAERMHANPERPAFARPFQDAAAALHDDIPELSDDEIYARLMKLLAILNDGHTGIYGPGDGSPVNVNGRILPLKFYAFPEGIYVVDGVGAWAELAEQRVIRFGALEAEEVLERMSTLRGVDNPMTWRWMGPQFYLGRLLALQSVGASSDGKSVELTLEAPDGTSHRRTVPGGYHEIQRKLRPSPATAGKSPLWLSDIETNYWLRALPEIDAVYVQFNQVRDAEDESIAEFAERLRRVTAVEGVRTLIVDVRHNNGGNNSLVLPLVRAMIEFEMRGGGREIFVLSGRNTFSAAQNFVNRVEQWTDAIFVGEPSSSSPNFVGEETHLRLPYSRIGGSISTQYWQDSSPGDRREWIPMDIPVELSARDYFAGRDPVLDEVLRRLVLRSALKLDG